MVLSIGMIVKNEEKYLEQCLTALQPILNELDSELIIADTGSTDRTVEIAKKFTDNVFHFEWINDFAAARNSTLERAKGEWYMFIDADEIAVDCTDVIKFFKSGEYKEFKSATYVVRSLSNENEQNRYFDFRPVRAVLREADTKFENPIHEILYPYYTPTKYLDFVVMHYGYVFSGEDGKKRAQEKSKRNLELLFNELNNDYIDKHRPNIYRQIADCYYSLDDLENALTYLDIGLEKVDHHSLGIVMYYSQKIAILSKLERYDELIALSDEYFDAKKNPFHTSNLASDCYIRAARGRAYFQQDEYSRSTDEFIKFFDLYKKYCSGRLNTPDLSLDTWKTTDEIVKASYNFFFFCCLQEKNYELANDYAKEMPLEKYLDDKAFLQKHIDTRIKIMKYVGFDGLDTLYGQLDDFGKEYLRRAAFSTDTRNRAALIKKLSGLGGAAAETAEIYKGYFDSTADYWLVREFLEKHGSENAEDLLYILLKSQMDITPFLLTEDFFADRAAQVVISFFPDGTELFERYDIANVAPEGLHSAVVLYGYLLPRVLERDGAISALFEKYGALGRRWYSTFGNANMPGDVLAALLANNVVIAVRSRDKAEFTNALAELKKLVPALIEIADAYERENKDAFPAPKPQNEFAQLAAQVKRNIRDLIADGNLSDARSLLAEFESICPADPEVAAMKRELGGL